MQSEGIAYFQDMTFHCPTTKTTQLHTYLNKYGPENTSISQQNIFSHDRPTKPAGVHNNVVNIQDNLLSPAI